MRRKRETTRNPVPANARKVLRRTVLTCLGLFVLYFALPVDRHHSPTALVLRVSVSTLALAGLIVVINRQLVRHIDQPDAPLGALLAGLIGGLLFFALLDYIIAIHNTTEFVDLHTRIDALYFALATLLTVGFGDVHAEGQLARSVLCVQMVFNVAVLATAASMFGRQISERVRNRSR
jgi:voltage-gated potassium channel